MDILRIRTEIVMENLNVNMILLLTCIKNAFFVEVYFNGIILMLFLLKIFFSQDFFHLFYSH